MYVLYLDSTPCLHLNKIHCNLLQFRNQQIYTFILLALKAKTALYPEPGVPC